MSIEAQFLGGLSDNKRRPTGNVCTPGTDIVLEIVWQINTVVTSSATLMAINGVQVHIVVDGNRQFQHRINNEVVMTYRSPQLTADMANAKLNTQPALRRALLPYKVSPTQLTFAVWPCVHSIKNEHPS